MILLLPLLLVVMCYAIGIALHLASTGRPKLARSRESKATGRLMTRLGLWSNQVTY